MFGIGGALESCSMIDFYWLEKKKRTNTTRGRAAVVGGKLKRCGM